MYQDRRVNKLLKEDFYRVASGTWSSSISLVRELLIKPEEHIEPGKYWKYPAPHSAWKDRQASLMCEVYSISLSFIHKIVAKNFKHVCHLPTKNLRGGGGMKGGGGLEATIENIYSITDVSADMNWKAGVYQKFLTDFLIPSHCVLPFVKGNVLNQCVPFLLHS